MLDTTVLIAASGGRVRSDQAGACRPLFEALIQSGKPILVATPSFAEFLRSGLQRDPPRLAGFEVVPFDRRAARALAEKFPKEALTRYRDESDKGQPPLQYIKYDAMIVACALRHKADVFVSIDTDQRKMASAVGLRVAWPRDFFAQQLTLVR